LTNAGHRLVSVFSSDGRSAEALVSHLARGLTKARESVEEIAWGTASFDLNIPIGDVVIIAVSDRSISEVDVSLARRLKEGDRRIVVHTSGALTSSALGMLSSAGHAVGSMHPLQSFDRREPSEIDLTIFESLPVIIEGDSEAVDMAWNLTESLGSRPFRINSEGKTAYHLAAVLSCNFFATLLSAADSLLPDDRLPDDRLREDLLPAALTLEIMKPLAAQALTNVFDRLREGDAGAAMTGPVARGDSAILQQHLELLKTDHPELLQLYTTLSTATARNARSNGLLQQTQFEEITALLVKYGGI